jgi:hypothetical protein
MQGESCVNLKKAVMEWDGPHVQSDIEGVEAVPHGTGSSSRKTVVVRQTLPADAGHATANKRADGWVALLHGRLACWQKRMAAMDNIWFMHPQKPTCLLAVNCLII